ncbi:MAG TPA: nuclear transport factor 2 family protein [Arenimonas sp.]|nr:nuclear transport factor 2 family protein [Arenimonas sp.]
MTPSPLAAWHQIVREGNGSGVAALLADDVVFHSPVVHTPQVGKRITTHYLMAAVQVFFNPSFRYVREVVGERDAVLEFETVIDGITVNGVDMMAWNDDGLVTSFKVMVRPLKAIQLIHEKMGAMLQSAR